MSREIPADVADLPTIEAEYWVTTTEDRVGMEGPVFDDEGNLFVCSVGMTYPINYILQVDEDKNITTVWEGALSPLGLAIHENGKLFAVCREGELLIMDKDGTNVTSITPTYDGKIFSLNDLCFTPDGDLIVTDWQGTTGIPIANVIIPEREQGSRMMSSNLAIKPGTNEAYLMTAGFGEGSHIYVFETLNME